MQHLPDNPNLLYVTDPMCAWCYGFTPVIRRLQALWRGRINVNVIVGGLNPYPDKPIGKEEKRKLAVGWHQVQERTGLPFDYSFFLRQSYVYNTEPACRALLAIRLLRPVLTLEVLRALHSAFYADGKDLTDLSVLIDVAAMFGVPENLFLTLFEAEDIMQQTEEEFDFVRDIGNASFPSLYLEQDGGYELITNGYCDLDELEDRIMEHLVIRQY